MTWWHRDYDMVAQRLYDMSAHRRYEMVAHRHLHRSWGTGGAKPTSVCIIHLHPPRNEKQSVP